MGKGYWRVLTNRFPYAVIYVERDEDVFIVAVAHTSQRPGYWKNRLADVKQ
jgi:plasmid stabilization system protein ParE